MGEQGKSYDDRTLISCGNNWTTKEQNCDLIGLRFVEDKKNLWFRNKISTEKLDEKQTTILEKVDRDSIRIVNKGRRAIIIGRGNDDHNNKVTPKTYFRLILANLSNK